MSQRLKKPRDGVVVGGCCASCRWLINRLVGLQCRRKNHWCSTNQFLRDLSSSRTSLCLCLISGNGDFCFQDAGRSPVARWFSRPSCRDFILSRSSPRVSCHNKPHYVSGSSRCNGETDPECRRCLDQDVTGERACSLTRQSQAIALMSGSIA